jgi:hypothetical protein
MTGFISGYNTGSTILDHNNGGGSFAAVSTPFVQVGYSAGVWGDCDNDGSLNLRADQFGGYRSSMISASV